MNLISPVKAIDELWIEKLASRPIKVAKSVNIEGLVLCVTSDGRLYSNKAERYCYTPGNYMRHEKMFRALKALGVLSKAQIERHKAACDASDAARHARWAAESMVKNAEKTGIPLSAAQKKFVAKHGKTKD